MSTRTATERFHTWHWRGTGSRPPGTAETFRAIPAPNINTLTGLLIYLWCTQVAGSRSVYSTHEMKWNRNLSIKLTRLPVNVTSTESISWLLIWRLLGRCSYNCVQNVINAFSLWTMTTRHFGSCQCMLTRHFRLTFVYTHEHIKLQDLASASTLHYITLGNYL